jgi:capsular exopolysaccharide synthesis family protein
MPLLPKAKTVNTARLLTSQSSGATAESVRIIRTNVLLSNPNALAPCILVTSPSEGEGKTTLSVNLAMSVAQLENRRVILINTDLRKPFQPHIHEIYQKVRNAKGLADFLAGTAEFEEIIHQTDIANLSVISQGKRPSNPSELLHSKQMSHLLNRCREAGFHIILDAPPVLPVTDAVILASQVDGVLLVASAGQTSWVACRLAIQRLTSAGGKLLGIVLQKAEVPTTPYYYYASEYGSAPPTSSSSL